MRMSLVLSAFLAVAAVSATGDEQLRMAVTPAQSFAPANLWIRTRVVPHADNRSLEVIAESTDFYRSSLISLDGEYAASTNLFEFRGMPGGEYLISGILTDSRGSRRAIAKQQVTVVSTP
jgi:hypothetical protein